MNQVETKETSYIIDGKTYTRITYLAELFDSDWKGKWIARVGLEEAERITREAAEFGTNVHDICHAIDAQSWADVARICKKDEQLGAYAEIWERWMSGTVNEIIGIEELVWSDKLKVAGRIDRICVLKGDKKPSIVDIKTGNLHDSIGIQLAGYKILYNAKHKRKVDRVLVAHMPRKAPGTLRISNAYDDPKYIKQFKEILKIHSIKRR